VWVRVVGAGTRTGAHINHDPRLRPRVHRVVVSLVQAALLTWRYGTGDCTLLLNVCRQQHCSVALWVDLTAGDAFRHGVH
jgi:hypothetical protein